MSFLRRTFLLGLTICAAAPAWAAEKVVYRVNGAVSPSNYKGLEAFLFNSMDAVIGLKLGFEASEDGPDGSVAAGESDGKFVAYLRGGGESEIVANEGFGLSRGAYAFDGFFVVKSGGIHQGIVSIFLDKADEASVLMSDAEVRDIDVDRLKAEIRD